MSFVFDKTLCEPFNAEDHIAPSRYKVVTACGFPAEILMFAYHQCDDLHHCSAVVYRWAQLDVRGDVVVWHITTCTLDGTSQMGSAHNLRRYNGDISLTKSRLEIW